ncbi:ABC transporter substrate-binding protein [Celerinatantimonas sp. YJH-8]|uniref:ABC transporter substrate-binding protein n=1 Tax=Celerinatantimonas sp. YJH-8 TaxID=3228714 RepID=UPI0038C3E2E1
MKNLIKGLGSIALLLAAVGASSAHAADTLRIGLASDPDMLDPDTARTYYGRFVFEAMCDRLVDVDQNLKIVPQLATDWSWSDHNTTLTLHLRHDVTFHDGEKFDASSVVYNLKRSMTMVGSLRKSELQAVAAVKQTGPYTVVFKLKTPDASLLSKLADRAGTMLAPQATEKGHVASHPVCSGPYQFVSRVAQDKIVLKRFENYWNKPAYHFDQVVFLPIPDASVRLSNLRAGDLDVITAVAASDIKTVNADASVFIAKNIGLGYQALNFNINNHNPTSPLAKSALVRRAFAAAIDRHAINQVVFEGQYTPANQPFSPVSPFHVDIPVAGRDIAKAKQWLSEAGVTSPIDVNLMVENTPVAKQVGQIIQAMVAEAGFNVHLQMTEFATLLNRQQNGQFEVSLSGWSGRPDPDGDIYGFVASSGNLNDGKYTNASVDKWLVQARQHSDMATRKALYQHVVEQMQADMPIQYLYFEPRIFGLNKKVQHFTVYPDGLIRLAGVSFAH